MPLARNPNTSSIPLGSDAGAPTTTETPLFDGPGLAITANQANGEAVSNNSTISITGGVFPFLNFTFTWTEEIRGFSGFIPTYETLDGSPNNAGGTFSGLVPTSGTGTVFTSGFIPAPNSQGIVTITVPVRAAEAVADPSGRYGPENAAVFSFTYNNAQGAIASPSRPSVDISTPSTLTYSATTYIMSFNWNVPLSEQTFTTDDINITGGTLDTDTFSISDDPRRYSVEIDLTGSGTVNVSIAVDAVTSAAGVDGPAEETSVSFPYDTTIADVTPTVSGGAGVTVTDIYDSEWQAIDSSNHLLGFDSDDERRDLGVTVGGGYKGVQDFKRIGNDLYGVAQIQQQRGSSGELSVDSQARAVLFKIQAQADSTPERIKQYYGITEAARSIIARDVNGTDQIAFFEGSQYADYFSIPTETNDWRSRVGYVHSISQSAINIAQTDKGLGLNWRSKFNDPNATVTYDNTVYGIHRGTTAPMLSLNNNLYIFSGYSSPRFISSQNYVTTQLSENEAQPITFIDNMALVRLGSTLLFNLPLLEVNGRTGFDVINNLAELVLCYIGFTPDGDFFMTPKYPRESLFTSYNSGTLIDRNRNRDFPPAGTLMIGNELLTYTARIDTQFTTVTRGAYGTTEGSPTSCSSIFYVDHVIDLTENYLAKPINELVLRSDSSQLYNQIRLKYGNDEREVFKEDPDSVNENKGRELERSLPLDRHQRVWVEWLVDQYLKQYAKLQYIGEISMKPSFHLQVGETIAIREPERTHLSNYKLFQVIRVTQNQSQLTTDIQVRTLNR